jgi:class 3 adenylate cyclase
VLGDGPRDVVLVLDWTSHLEVLWEQSFVEDFLTSLTRFARVLWFDMRGVGLSDRVAAEVPAEEWMEDVGVVMDAAGSERATLIGHGHAAQMVLMFAATYPERVDSLVLINGFARLARDDDYPAGVPPEVHGLLTEGIEQQWGTGAMAAVLAPSIADRPGLQDWYGRVERNAAGPGTAVAMMRATLDLDVREILPLVAAPTLVVQNRDNEVVRAGHGRYLAEHLPNARLLERESADHWPLPDPDLLGALEEFIAGSRSEVHAERFLATVLVCDVAGSTERVAEIGDERWRTLRDRFEETVRRELHAHRGDFVDAAGDGVLATFDGPARAIRCARHIRESVQRSGIDVRSGLHTGEVTRRVGGIAGIAVHIAARVSSTAKPGEVLVTRTVRDLVAGSGIVLEDRGEHELKGVPERWPIYAVS